MVPKGEFRRVCEIIDTEALRVDLFNITPGNPDFKDSTLTDWLAEHGVKHGIVLDYLRFLLRALLGVEPEAISAFYFLDYVKSGLGIASLVYDDAGSAQYLRLRQGLQSSLYSLYNQAC